MGKRIVDVYGNMACGYFHNKGVYTGIKKIFHIPLIHFFLIVGFWAKSCATFSRACLAGPFRTRKAAIRSSSSSTIDAKTPMKKPKSVFGIGLLLPGWFVREQPATLVRALPKIVSTGSFSRRTKKVTRIRPQALLLQHGHQLNACGSGCRI